MPDIDAPTFELPDIPDYEPTRARITEIEQTTGSEKYGNQPRLRVQFEFPDRPDEPEHSEFMNLKLGAQRNGEVATLRKLLNAVAGRAESEPVTRFNSDSGAIYHDAAKQVVSAHLRVGCELVVRGTRTATEDGGERWKIRVYQPLPEQKAVEPPEERRTATEPSAPPVRPETASPAPGAGDGAPSAGERARERAVADDDEVPF